MPSAANASISAGDTWTDAIQARGSALVDVSISGVNGHTVAIQRKVVGVWRTVEEHTEDAERVLQSGSHKDYRVGIPTGGTGTGAVSLDIRAGNSI